MDFWVTMLGFFLLLVQQGGPRGNRGIRDEFACLHVKRAADTIIGEVLVLPVDGRRPPGRPKKTWLDCVNEDLKALGIQEGMALD